MTACIKDVGIVWARVLSPLCDELFSERPARRNVTGKIEITYDVQCEGAMFGHGAPCHIRCWGYHVGDEFGIARPILLSAGICGSPAARME